VIAVRKAQRYGNIGKAMREIKAIDQEGTDEAYTASETEILRSLSETNKNTTSLAQTVKDLVDTVAEMRETKPK
tara:strand:- start:97 stop:318 length:222 start_codon:yes stop_codon:yes gene_type:complete